MEVKIERVASAIPAPPITTKPLYELSISMTLDHFTKTYGAFGPSLTLQVVGEGLRHTILGIVPRLDGETVHIQADQRTHDWTIKPIEGA